MSEHPASGDLAALTLAVALKKRDRAHYDYAHNAQLDSVLYGERWYGRERIAAIKHRYDSSVESSA